MNRHVIDLLGENAAADASRSASVAFAHIEPYPKSETRDVSFLPIAS